MILAINYWAFSGSRIFCASDPPSLRWWGQAAVLPVLCDPLVIVELRLNLQIGLWSSSGLIKVHLHFFCFVTSQSILQTPQLEHQRKVFCSDATIFHFSAGTQPLWRIEFWDKRRIMVITQRRRRRCRLVVMNMMAVVRRRWRLTTAAVIAVARGAGASREAVSIQVSCVRAIRISVQNQFASIPICFSFVLLQSSKMEFKPLNRSFERAGWETGVPALKTFPPTINVYTHTSFVYLLLQMDHNLTRSTKFWFMCTALLWPRSSNLNSFDFCVFILFQQKETCWGSKMLLGTKKGASINTFSFLSPGYQRTVETPRVFCCPLTSMIWWNGKRLG